MLWGHPKHLFKLSTMSHLVWLSFTLGRPNNGIGQVPVEAQFQVAAKAKLLQLGLLPHVVCCVLRVGLAC